MLNGTASQRGSLTLSADINPMVQWTITVRDVSCCSGWLGQLRVLLCTVLHNACWACLLDYWTWPPFNLPGPVFTNWERQIPYLTESQRPTGYPHLVWPICWDSLPECGCCICYNYWEPQVKAEHQVRDQRWTISPKKRAWQNFPPEVLLLPKHINQSCWAPQLFLRTQRGPQIKMFDNRYSTVKYGAFYRKWLMPSRQFLCSVPMFNRPFPEIQIRHAELYLARWFSNIQLFNILIIALGRKSSSSGINNKVLLVSD